MIQNNSKIENFEIRNNTNLDFIDAHFSKKAFDERLKQEANERLKREAEERLISIKLDERLKREAKERDKERAKDRREQMERSKKLDEQLNRMDKQIGGLNNKWGEFTEHMLKPRLLEMFRNKGFVVQTIYPQIEGLKNGKTYYSIDWLLVNSAYVVVVEVKSKLKMKHVDEHLVRMRRIQEVQPQKFDFKKTTLIGAIAGMVIEDGVEAYAIENGFYILKQSGNMVEISNPDVFQPTEWKIM